MGEGPRAAALALLACVLSLALALAGSRLLALLAAALSCALVLA